MGIDVKMQILRQSTEVIVRVGPFVDVGDGFTPQTDIALSGDEAELLKNASVEVDISGRTWAAVTNCRGWYDLTLTTSDTDTVGLLTVIVQDDSDCLPVFRDFQVIEEAVYDEMFKAAAAGVQGVIEVNGLDHVVALQTTVASVTTADTVFKLTAGATDNDAYNNMIISIKDVSSGDIRSRRATDYVGGSDFEVTVDYDFEFPIAAGDIVTIFASSYSQTADAAAAGDIRDTILNSDSASYTQQGSIGQKIHHSGRGRY